MKRIVFVLIMCLFAVGVEKPTISTAKVWEMTGKYYMRVTMPDGSTVELKSDKFLTKVQWQKLANDYQKVIEAIPEPRRCPTCGQLIL